MWQAVAALLLLLPLPPPLLAGSLLRDPVGSPGELAWQAWLLMDSRGPSAQRRITPKSVFIAPAFTPQALPACADGYQADAMGRCVKLVRVNQAAQLDFLLKRLNSMYAAPSVEDAAPLKVPLPIATATLAPDTLDPAIVAPPEISVVMADVKRSSSNDSSEESSEGSSEPVVSVWSIKNGTVSNTDSNSTVSVEIPTEAERMSEDQDPTPELAAFKVPPLTKVLTPTDIVDSLPMLVLSPQTSLSSLEHNTFQASSQPLEQDTKAGTGVNVDTISNVSSADDLGTGGQRPQTPDLSLRLGLIDFDTDSIQNSSHTNNSEQLRPSDESVKSAPEMNEQESTQENETSDEVTAATDASISGLVSHSVKRKQSVDDLYTSEGLHHQGFVRFPEEKLDSSKDSSELHSVNLFTSTYVKFPSEDSYKHNNKPSPETVQYHKQTFWWLPAGWQLDRQRQQPTLLRFWSRMPLQTDPSLVPQYSPSYGQQYEDTSVNYKHEQSSYRPSWPRH